VLRVDEPRASWGDGTTIAAEVARAIGTLTYNNLPPFWRCRMRTTRTLKGIVARRSAVQVPGAANALFARVIEDLGFEAAYVTGAGIANMHLGAPDIGLTTLTEIANTVAAISDAVALPLIVDADTGFGNAVNMVRTVRVLERAGAAGLQIEDQVFPKKCGHFGGKDVIALHEMVQKVKAAVDTRRDRDLQIIARTDARAVEGLDRAIERAHAYIAAGADVAFVEAPTSSAELAHIAHEIEAPQVVNIVFGGKTPDPGRAELARMGFSLVLYANAALQAALKAAIDVLGALKRDGSLDGAADQLASFEERQRVVNKPTWDALENRFQSSGSQGST
jgi:2-methylisocitrate lyase-like PEP mutase family enzyme